MNKEQILKEIQSISSQYNTGLNTKKANWFETALQKALALRKVVDEMDDALKAEFDNMYSNGFYHLDYGLHSQSYNCMNLLGRYEDMLPYLEKAITYMNNPRNPEMWRILGLLYLAQKSDLEKACEAWKKAIDLNPTLLEKYSGLSVVHVYDAMKKAGKKITWKVEHVDLKTGNFSVVFSAE